jgi:hypothetical protein
MKYIAAIIIALSLTACASPSLVAPSPDAPEYTEDGLKILDKF